jgi:ComF family protein
MASALRILMRNTALGLLPLLKGIKDLCFPAACLACGTRLPNSSLPLFCVSCRQELTFPESPLCSCCGLPFPSAGGEDHLCSICLKGRHFSRARALFLYAPGIAHAIHGWKYGRNMAALASFGFFFTARQSSLALKPFDLIIPVPLHPARLRQRGFNQAQLLARALFPERRKALFCFLLERQRATPAQTGLTGELRRRNVKGAFMVNAPEKVAGRAILLVDDVLTTGATVEECAKILVRAGARDVQVLTLARVADQPA